MAVRQLLDLAAPATLVVLLATLPSATPAQGTPPATRYPVVRADTTSAEYHGTPVSDPYRWLEGRDNPEVSAFLVAQRQFTSRVMERLPQHDAIRRRLTELRDVPRTTTGAREGGRLFALRRLSGRPVAALAMRETDGAPWQVVVDPATFSTDGSVQVGGWSVAPGGRLVAYSRAQSGTDAGRTIHVRDVDSGQDLNESVRGDAWPGVCWTPDASGYFYYTLRRGGISDSAGTRDATELYYHRLGTPQAMDRLLHAWIGRRGASPPFLRLHVTDDGSFLVVGTNGASGPEGIFAFNLGTGGPATGATVVRRLDASVPSSPRILGTSGHTLFVLTSLNASRGRIVRIELDSLASAQSPPSWHEVVPESEDPIEEAILAGGQLVVSYTADPRLERISLDGKVLGRIPTSWGGSGALGAFLAERRVGAPELFFNFTSAVMPRSGFVYDFRSGETRAVDDDVGVQFDPGLYETKRITFPSKDGTTVPMTITARRGLVLDGSHPTMLEGYGAYGTSSDLTFFPENVAWLEMGGVLAYASPRGGGELGEQWHRDGMLERKQNSIDDFIAAAEYLVRAGYTSPSRLGVMGYSAGGMLVGAALIQRPDLFAVAIPQAGHYDMLRFAVMSDAGRAWIPEFGSPDDPQAFEYLRAYSPLHNVRPGTCYPATLVVARSEDDRVVPNHSFKFVAALQAAQAASPGCERPTLLRMGAGSHLFAPSDAALEETADIWAFAAARLGATTGTGRGGPRSSPHQ